MGDFCSLDTCISFHLLSARLALERKLEELLTREAEIPGEVGMAQDEKDAAIREARRRRALRNSLTRYSGKVSGRGSFYIYSALFAYFLWYTQETPSRFGDKLFGIRVKLSNTGLRF